MTRNDAAKLIQEYDNARGDQETAWTIYGDEERETADRAVSSTRNALIAALCREPNQPEGGSCQGCGLPYGGDAWIEALVPCDVWAKITPAPADNPMGGTLCISCIAKRCRELGLKEVPVWMVGTEVLRARSGEPTKEEFLGHWQKVGE